MDLLKYTQLFFLCSLRSKRFQSSYCAKVRAGAKKVRSPPPPPLFILFFALVPAFQTNLARKRLLRRLLFMCHAFWKENIEDTIEISRFNFLRKGNNGRFGKSRSCIQEMTFQRTQLLNFPARVGPFPALHYPPVPGMVPYLLMDKY